jgi:hypothetical protein
MTVFLFAPKNTAHCLDGPASADISRMVLKSNSPSAATSFPLAWLCSARLFLLTTGVVMHPRMLDILGHRNVEE